MPSVVFMPKDDRKVNVVVNLLDRQTPITPTEEMRIQSWLLNWEGVRHFYRTIEGVFLSIGALGAPIYKWSTADGRWIAII